MPILKQYIPSKTLRLKKTKTYILLIAVIAIWGTFAYKIIAGMSPNDHKQPELATLKTFTPNNESSMDTFSIEPLEKDPFLGTFTRKKTVRKFTKKRDKLDSISSTISYSGMVKKQESRQQIFILNINNQQYLLKKGQTILNVKLIYGNSKKVVILSNGKRQSILKH